MYDKEGHPICITNFKKALNIGLVLTKMYKVIKFNQKAWLKPYININAELF